MDRLKYLLNNYIVYKSKDEDIFYSIKDNYLEYKEFVEEYLKYKLVRRPDFLKLEKEPGRNSFSYGIQDFKSIQDYTIFLKILYYLDTREKGSQFLFSELKNSIDLNWLDGKNRMSLTRVLRYSLLIPIIKEIDSSDEYGIETELLLESTGLSRYVILSNYSEDDRDEIDLRTRVYRDLVMNSVIYSESEAEYEYCKKYQEDINESLNEFLGWSIQIHKNMVVTVVNDVSGLYKSFPARDDLDKICLQFNSLIREKILSKEFNLKQDDTLVLDNYLIDSLMEELQIKNEMKWTKLSRDKKLQNLKIEVLERLEFFKFLKIEENTIKIYPLCGKMVGEYGE